MNNLGPLNTRLFPLFDPLGGAGAGTGPEVPRGQGQEAVSGFQQAFMKALDEVNALQLASDKAGEDLVTGRTDDVAKVMMTAQQAELSLQLTIQLRNKLLEAYQEVMRMPV